MRAILCLLIFSTILCNAAFVNLCKIHDCKITTKLVSDPTLDIPPAVSTYPNIQNNTFVYVASTTLDKLGLNETASSVLDVIIQINNMTLDFCGRRLCWMRIRVDETCDFEGGGLSGYYEFENHTLMLYPSVMVAYSSPNCPILFETCVQDPLTPTYNHCADGLTNSKQLMQIRDGDQPRPLNMNAI